MAFFDYESADNHYDHALTLTKVFIPPRKEARMAKPRTYSHFIRIRQGLNQSLAILRQ